FAPERLQAVTADARTGASWRAGLRLPEPSPPLNHVIHYMNRAVRAATAAGGPPLDALLAAVRDSQPGEPGLDKLAHQVPRSALEQRQARQANERAGFLADIASHRAQHIIDRTFDLMGAEEGCSRCLPPPREPTRRGPGSRATPGGVLMAASPTDLR